MAAEPPRYKLVGSSSAEAGHAEPGEEVVFTARLTEKGNGVDGVPLQLRLHVEGEPVKWIDAISKAEGNTIKASRKTPGFIYFYARIADKTLRKGSRRWSVGVAVQPDKIEQALPEPKDFDAFWAGEIKKLDAVPIRAERTPVKPEDERAEPYKDKVDCWRVRIDCAGGRQAFGYLTMPKGATRGTLPARIIYPGAGIYAIRPDWDSAAKGFLTLAVNIHGVEPGGTEAELLKKLKDRLYYTARGWEDRQTVSFHGGFLRSLRALQYLKSLPQWNGKTLVASGASQGGALALAMSGLDPDVTFCFAGVPGLCNLAGPKANQTKGWPLNFNLGKPEVVKTTGYYDNCNFARRIKAEVLVTVGYLDWLCPPSNAWAAYNNIPGKKTMWANPAMGHGARWRYKEIVELMRRHAGLAEDK